MHWIITAAILAALCAIAYPGLSDFDIGPSAEAHGTCANLNGSLHPVVKDGTHDADGDGIGCESNRGLATSPVQQPDPPPLTLYISISIATTLALATVATGGYLLYRRLRQDAATDEMSETDTLCQCGQPNHSGYSRCSACMEFPNRTPGICATCGNGCRPDFARCFACKQAEQSGRTRARHLTPQGGRNTKP